MNKIILLGSPHEQLQPANLWALTPLPFANSPTLTQCSCRLCLYFESEMRARESQSLYRSLGQQKVSSQDYQLVLRSLTLPKNKIILGPISVRIPEICFYKQGQPVSIFLNKELDDLTVKELRKNINQTLIKKTLGERRRKYKEATEKAIGADKSDRKQVAIVHLLSGQSYCMNELQFLNMLNKRKSDPFWSRVNYVVNCLNSKLLNSQRFMFFYHESTQSDLAKRALNFCLSLGEQLTSINPQFITPEQQNIFQRTLDSQTRIRYATYKTVSFMRRFHNVEVESGLFDWLVDQLESTVLLNVTNLKYKQMPKYDWTRQTYFKAVDISVARTLALRPRHLKIELNAQRVSRLEEGMNLSFHKLKEKFGFLQQVSDVDQVELTDKAYQILRPEIKGKLSQLISRNTPMERLKPSSLRIDRYKKKSFNRMTNALHNLTGPRKWREVQTVMQKTLEVKCRQEETAYSRRGLRSVGGRRTGFN